MIAAKTHVFKIARRVGALALGLIAAAALMRGPLAAIAEEGQPVTEIPKIELSGAASFKSKLQAMSANDGETDLNAVTEVWKKLRAENGSTGVDPEAMAEALRRLEAEGVEQRTTASGGDVDTRVRRYTSDDLEMLSADRVNAADTKANCDQLGELAEHAMIEGLIAKQESAVAKVRNAARKIDSIAADLDDAGFEDEADALFERSRAMREAARDAVNQQWDYFAGSASLHYNMRTLRAQLSFYASEHGGKYPGISIDENGRGSLPQLMCTTNEKGEIGTGEAYRLGPYLPSMPENALWKWGDASGIDELKHWPPRGGERKSGWLYHQESGTIVPNLRELKQTRGLNPTF